MDLGTSRTGLFRDYLLLPTTLIGQSRRYFYVSSLLQKFSRLVDRKSFVWIMMVTDRKLVKHRSSTDMIIGSSVPLLHASVLSLGSSPGCTTHSGPESGHHRRNPTANFTLIVCWVLPQMCHT